ncbi:MAG TPA: alkaline phosphatase family protein, partial [Roseiflexaceae bacterium]|nr:alkaline phosphatase family protein [Roseiflexaceae bacterium]
AARFSNRFIRPLYDGYGFAQIPQTIRYLLTDSNQKGVPFGPRDDLYQKYDTVILFFVDAFGWRFFEQYHQRSPFLRRAAEDGLVSTLTSQFPSTTAAHVTAIHTGLPVGQSGVYEWYYYEPLLDRMIAPLLFSFAGDKWRDTLEPTGVSARALYPTRTLYHDLQPHGVDSIVLQNHTYADSPYTQIVTDGARVVPYRTLPEALITLDQLLDAQKRRSYYFVYVDSIDTICHRYGPESAHTAAEIEVFLATMELIFHKRMAQHKRRALCMLTADHGQVAIDPATTIYLNQRFPQLLPYLMTNRAGQPLAPAGSSRDMFLHIKHEHLDEAHAFLRQALQGRAEIYRVQELIEQGFFGANPPSAAFMSRVGNLVILPYQHETVWWYEQGRFEQKFYGSHGGLTPEEMQTLLLVQSYR